MNAKGVPIETPNEPRGCPSEGSACLREAASAKAGPTKHGEEPRLRAVTYSGVRAWAHFMKNDLFTPLENPSIYAGDGGNRKHQLIIEGGVKALPFLTGFT